MNYTVTFTESGISVGTAWSVWLNSTGSDNLQTSTGLTLSFAVPNGTYAYVSYESGSSDRHDGSNGTVTVAGAPVNATVSFAREYSVTFTETGLPSGSYWIITVSGTGFSSTAAGALPSLSALAPNGTANYLVSYTPTGWYILPPEGVVTVNGTNVSVPLSATSQTYAVTFTESGLPSGRGWAATLDGIKKGMDSTVSYSIDFSVPNGSYPYALQSWSAPPNPTPAENVPILVLGSVTVSGNAVGVSVNFSSIPTVQFRESGLAAGTPWDATVDGIFLDNSTTSTMSAELSSGSYALNVSAEKGGYAEAGAPSTLTISGSNTTVSARFRLLPGFDAVTFASSSKTNGTGWDADGWTFWSVCVRTGPGFCPLVEVGLSANISFALRNGTYNWSADPELGSMSPWNGNITVNGGPNITVNLTWTPPSSNPSYPLQFVESGLPSGAVFTVDLPNKTRTQSATSNGSSPGASVSFLLDNSSYLYSVGPVAGYTASPSGGTVTVQGRSQSISVQFTANQTQAYSVYFNESGLPNGTAWSVDLNGTTRSSTSPSIRFTEPNGAYRFNASCGANYTASPASGDANVTGGTLLTSITCTNASGLVPVSFGARGIAANVPWTVTLTASSTGLTIELAGSLVKSASGSSTISFRVSFGSYSYSASTPGYQDSSGRVVVNGPAPQAVEVQFTPAPGSHSNEPALALTGWAPVSGLVFLAVAALGLGAIAYRSRSRRIARGRALVARLSETDWQLTDEDPVREQR